MSEKGSVRGWKDRKHFFGATTGAFVLLQLLLLANMSYMFGSTFRMSRKAHNFNILYVDFDGGVIGESVLQAYSGLQAETFPTIEQQPVDGFSSPADVRDAVCRGEYWGAVYTNANASSQLASALSGEISEYNDNAMGYIWNGARYSSFSSSYIHSNLITLVSATRQAYYATNGTAAFEMVSSSSQSSTAMNALFDPIEATETNIKATSQGSVFLYNTIVTVMAILQNFFFAMAFVGVSVKFGLLTHTSYTANVAIRLVAAISFSFVAALCLAGYMWAFKETWSVNSNQFVLVWMITWLFMHINILVVDFVTTFLPLPGIPFFLLTWIIVNVASTLTPFELSPGFYKWSYALPGHEWYQVMVQIWSGGCNNQLHIALPVLFIPWWLLGIVATFFTVRIRIKQAQKAEENPVTEAEAIHEVEEEEAGL